ncbi:MAG TPA: hypothetical protein VFG84_10500 [Gemmatimonadaceae bacterium]|nr:hypothetical protein [Gemmatimonadaceae bacterium]
MGSNGRLGLQDLRPKDAFELVVAAEGRTVSGVMLVPGMPAPVYRNEQGTESFSWAPVPGAASYFVMADTDAPTSARHSADTSYVLRRDLRPGRPVPDEPLFTVIALDANLDRFMSDTTVARAGITSGYGIFGAFVRVSVAIPEAP